MLHKDFERTDDMRYHNVFPPFSGCAPSGRRFRRRPIMGAFDAPFVFVVAVTIGGCLALRSIARRRFGVLAFDVRFPKPTDRSWAVPLASVTAYEFRLGQTVVHPGAYVFISLIPGDAINSAGPDALRHYT